MEKLLKGKKFLIILSPIQSETIRMIADKQKRSMHKQILYWIDEGIEQWFTKHIPKEE